MPATSDALTHARPRGRAPAHHKWDAQRGAWTHTETGVVRTTQTPPKQVVPEKVDVKILDVQWIPDKRRASLLLNHEKAALRIAVDGERGALVEHLIFGLASGSAAWTELYQRDASLLRGQVIFEEVVKDLAELHALAVTLLHLKPFPLETLLRPAMRASEAP